jgi:transposase
MSNRQIAEYVGVDEGTVRRFRHTMELTAEFPQSPNRTGRDGRKINTPSAFESENGFDHSGATKSTR